MKTTPAKVQEEYKRRKKYGTDQDNAWSKDATTSDIELKSGGGDPARQRRRLHRDKKALNTKGLAYGGYNNKYGLGYDFTYVSATDAVSLTGDYVGQHPLIRATKYVSMTANCGLRLSPDNLVMFSVVAGALPGSVAVKITFENGATASQSVATNTLTQGVNTLVFSPNGWQTTGSVDWSLLAKTINYTISPGSSSVEFSGLIDDGNLNLSGFSLLFELTNQKILTKWLPILSKYGIPATLAVYRPSNPGNGISPEDLVKLNKQHFWTLAASVTHTYNKSTAREIIDSVKQYYSECEALGINTGYKYIYCSDALNAGALPEKYSVAFSANQLNPEMAIANSVGYNTSYMDERLRKLQYKRTNTGTDKPKIIADPQECDTKRFCIIEAITTQMVDSFTEQEIEQLCQNIKAMEHSMDCHSLAEYNQKSYKPIVGRG